MLYLSNTACTCSSEGIMKLKDFTKALLPSSISEKVVVDVTVINI